MVENALEVNWEASLSQDVSKVDCPKKDNRTLQGLAKFEA